MPAENIEIWGGNNTPIIWRFRAGTVTDRTNLDLTGKELRLTVFARGKEILSKSTLGNTGLRLVSYLDIFPDSGADPAVLDTLVWDVSIADSRMQSVGASANYEIEQRYQTSQFTILSGTFTWVGGYNDD